MNIGRDPGTKIIHVLWSGETGGAERSVYQLAKYQHNHSSLDVSIGFGHAQGEFASRARRDGLAVEDFQMKSGRDVRAIPRAMSVFRKFDVHHFHSPEPLLMIASLACRGTLRVYTHRGGVMTYSGRRAIRYRVVKALLRLGFTHITGAPQAARAIERLFGIPKSAVAESINGIDLSSFASNSERRSRRATMNIHDDSLTLIGTAARLRPLKRIDWLLHAARGLEDEDWKILVLGDGPDRKRLERLAMEELEFDRVRFTGMVSDMGSWLPTLDIFVLPSGPEEGFGNAVVEAMAFGIPTVVCADSPALTSHVMSGRNGIVVGDVAEMTNALKLLVRDAQLRRQLGSTAQQDVLARYSMKRCSAMFEALYRRPRTGVATAHSNRTM